ncbi:MAG: dynamin family protein [Actinomycetes bacterium]
MTSSREPLPLLPLLEQLRASLAVLHLPLEVPDADAARARVAALAAQLDDYVLPRLRRMDAQMLAVVGGSTGAGKSTLVNALVGAHVSEPGVLRPTTRSPVLVHAPADSTWFDDERILPGLSRLTPGQATDRPGGPDELRVVAESSLPPGLALLDAPDIDSVVAANRHLAAELLAAADLWLFVTTAARYADSVPWEFLREAAARAASVAVVLDRVPPAAVAEVRADLERLLREERLTDAPLFVIPESALDDGALPNRAVADLRGWLRELAEDAQARDAVVRQTLVGALRSVRDRTGETVEALLQQERAAAELRRRAGRAYDGAATEVDAAVREGTLLRGEVLARWQEFVGTGELLRSLESRLGRLRDRVTAAVLGRPQPVEQVEEALVTGAEAVIAAAAAGAAERAARSWRETSAGAALLSVPGGEALSSVSPDLPQRAARLVRDWQGDVLELVRREAGSRRSTARVLSYGVNGVALVVMVAVFAHTGGLTGGEVAVAGGASAVGQKLLEALLGDQAVRELASQARQQLRQRVDALLFEELARYEDMLPPLDEDGRDELMRVRDQLRRVAMEHL